MEGGTIMSIENTIRKAHELIDFESNLTIFEAAKLIQMQEFLELYKKANVLIEGDSTPSALEKIAMQLDYIATFK